MDPSIRDAEGGVDCRETVSIRLCPEALPIVLPMGAIPEWWLTGVPWVMEPVGRRWWVVGDVLASFGGVLVLFIKGGGGGMGVREAGEGEGWSTETKWTPAEYGELQPCWPPLTAGDRERVWSGGYSSDLSWPSGVAVFSGRTPSGWCAGVWWVWAGGGTSVGPVWTLSWRKMLEWGVKSWGSPL